LPKILRTKHIVDRVLTLQVNVRQRRLETAGVWNMLRLNSTSSPKPRKYIILMQSSSPPSSLFDWVWPVFWPALSIIYLMDVDVFYPFYLVFQTVLLIGSTII